MKNIVVGRLHKHKGYLGEDERDNKASLRNRWNPSFSAGTEDRGQKDILGSYRPLEGGYRGGTERSILVPRNWERGISTVGQPKTILMTRGGELQNWDW